MRRDTTEEAPRRVREVETSGFETIGLLTGDTLEGRDAGGGRATSVETGRVGGRGSRARACRVKGAGCHSRAGVERFRSQLPGAGHTLRVEDVHGRSSIKLYVK